MNVFYTDSWETDTFVTNYLPFALFPALYMAARFYWKCRPIGVTDMDFISGLEEIEEYSTEEKLDKSPLKRFWAWLVSVVYSTLGLHPNATLTLYISQM